MRKDKIKFNKNINLSKFLIENDIYVSINDDDNDRWSQLMNACRYSEDLKLFKLLINAGANINYQYYEKGYSLLILTIWNEKKKKKVSSIDFFDKKWWRCK